MSALFDIPASPLQTKDIRSASLLPKRDKEHGGKWKHGVRPLGGRTQPLDYDEFIESGKFRPQKQFSQNATGIKKSHANKNPKPSNTHCHFDSTDVVGTGRLGRKTDAMVDATEFASSPLSRSLLELLPQHVNNTQSPIQTAIRETNVDAGILYSFDSKGRSPVDKASSVALDGLVEQAEMKWQSEQIDKMVKGEYEVLDNEGRPTALNPKGKKRGSPKQKATKTEIKNVEDDDGFELI
ncbi:hypothetical protein BGZ60DRAFT_528664 [Tricladium varicosporioides]|nr:hypothetical protein BGZ60DRAFT_528664 [Hymenoscyphus varicosporioides]